MTAFSYGTWMCLTKIPGPLADPAHSAGRAAWGVFLWFLSLHEQRKGRPRGERHHVSEIKTSPARPSKVDPIANVATANAVRRHGLRWPSPQPLPHRERDFEGQTAERPDQPGVLCVSRVPVIATATAASMRTSRASADAASAGPRSARRRHRRRCPAPCVPCGRPPRCR